MDEINGFNCLLRLLNKAHALPLLLFSILYIFFTRVYRGESKYCRGGAEKSCSLFKFYDPLYLTIIHELKVEVGKNEEKIVVSVQFIPTKIRERK